MKTRKSTTKNMKALWRTVWSHNCLEILSYEKRQSI